MDSSAANAWARNLNISRVAGESLLVIPLGKAEAGTASRLGFMAGEFSVPDDFDRMGANEIESLFAGRKP